MASILKVRDKDGNIVEIPVLRGPSGEDGVVFTPSVSDDGILSWSNDGGLDNPPAVNITGPAGPTGSGVAVGGTAGQVLKKASGTNYDTVWGTLTANDVGAIPTSQKGSANGIASLDNRGKVTATQSTSRVSNITDAAVTITEDMNGGTYILSASNAITVTVPDPASMPDGFEVEMVQWGTGKVSFAFDVSGKYLFSLDGARKIVGRYGVAVLKKIGASTWLLAGALE